MCLLLQWEGGSPPCREAQPAPGLERISPLPPGRGMPRQGDHTQCASRPICRRQNNTVAPKRRACRLHALLAKPCENFGHQRRQHFRDFPHAELAANGHVVLLRATDELRLLLSCLWFALCHLLKILRRAVAGKFDGTAAAYEPPGWGALDSASPAASSSPENRARSTAPRTIPV